LGVGFEPPHRRDRALNSGRVDRRFEEAARGELSLGPR
jgi:hypothetical protein